VSADHSKLAHINTYGALPEYVLYRPAVCLPSLREMGDLACERPEVVLRRG
jgi:hypothetical protein